VFILKFNARCIHGVGKPMLNLRGGQHVELNNSGTRRDDARRRMISESTLFATDVEPHLGLTHNVSVRPSCDV
jgi:hypothetical protein